MLAGLINDITPETKMYKQCILSAIIITFIEYVSGYILNIKLGLNIWDYTNLKFNLNGQISLIFSFAWVFLSYFAIKFDDMLKNDLCRKTMFNNKIN